MPSQRQLKSKIRAVGNIKQITKAMQMVAATKMRKSQLVALQSRPYAKKSLSLLLRLFAYLSAERVQSIYWAGSAGAKERDILSDKIALVVVTSDKGLAGSFNSAVLRQASQWKTRMEREGKEVDIVAVGKKARDFFRKRGANVVAEFLQYSDVANLAETAPLMDWLLAAYREKKYERIVFCSTQFISALVQKPEIHQVLPLEKEELDRIVEGIIPKTGKYSEIAKQEKEAKEYLQYILEPSAQVILQEVVQSLIRISILHLLFESNASEHSARMLAMKNATDNAERLGEELVLDLNKARQASITRELAEVTTAKEALTNE